MSEQSEGLGVPGSGPSFGPPVANGQPSYLPPAGQSYQPSARPQPDPGPAPGSYQQPGYQPAPPAVWGPPTQQPVVQPGAPVPPSQAQPAAAAPPGQPQAAATMAGPGTPAYVDYPPPVGEPAGRPERVGLGLLCALAAVLAGSVATALLLQAGWVFSLVALAMAWGGARLYQVGAGGPPRKGAWPLVVLLVVGVLFSWEVALAWMVHARAVSALGSEQAVSTTIQILLDSEFQGAAFRQGWVFLLFGALGIFSTVRGLLASRA
ncbi:MAG: hypothetical protein Q4G45_08715 [Actinomycetia bacterium]|nr:hypothetical protein [Actinomycetes bacterium]